MSVVTLVNALQLALVLHAQTVQGVKIVTRVEHVVYVQSQRSKQSKALQLNQVNVPQRLRKDQDARGVRAVEIFAGSM